MKKSYTLWLIALMLVSTIINAQTFPNGYCTVEGGGGNSYIGKVTINGQVMHDNMVQNSYTDYSSNADMQLEMLGGEAYPIEVLDHRIYGATYESVVVWIDYDQSGSFEDVEKTVLTGGAVIPNGEDEDILFSGTINVPADALAGWTKMRINCNSDDANEAVPCVCGYGEAEDYGINILPAGISPQFEVNKTEVSLNNEVVYTNTSFGGDISLFTWNFGEGASPATANSVGPHTVSYSTLGAKTVSLTISDGVDTKTSTKTNIVNVVAANVDLAKPNAVAATANYNTIALEWLSPNESYFANPEGFEGNGFPPKGWTSRQSDALNSEIRDLAGSQIRWSYNTHANNVHSGNGAVRIESNRPIYNWLTSPEVEVHEQQRLSFWLKMRNITEFHCQLNIMIKDGDADWVKLSTIEDVDYDVEEYKQQTIDLSAYANKKVRIAFVHHQHQQAANVAETMTKIALDDISIENNPGNTNTPSLKDEPTAYKIYVDNTLVETVDGDVRTYTIENLNAGTHQVAIAAVYDIEESMSVIITDVETTNAEVDFTISDTRIGIGEEVTYTADIKGSVASIEWDFGEGADFDISDAETVTGVYTSLGTKTVSVVVNGNVTKEKEAAVNVIRGVASVRMLKNVSVSNSANNVTVAWPSLLIDERLYDDFETGSLTDNGWSLMKSATIDGELTESNGQSNWFKNDKDSFSNGGTKYIKSGEYSVAIGYTAPDFSWLITPELNLGSADELKFWMWYKNQDDWTTNFRVMAKVSTDNDWTELLSYTAGDATNEMETEVAVDLSDFANETVQVAFVYEYTDGYQMGMDDIRIVSTVPNATPSDFSKLNIYRDDVLVKEITDGTLKEWVDADLETKIYEYSVTYVNAAGEEGQANESHKVWIYKPEVLPYSLDFETEEKLIFYDGETNFKVGQDGDFDKTGYNIPAHSGNYVAANLSEVEEGTSVWSRVAFAPLNLGEYGAVSFSLDYVNDGTKFLQLQGRETQDAPWKKIHNYDNTTEWTNKTIDLPLTALKNGYQLALVHDNGKELANGVAFDNVQVTPQLGKHIEVSYIGDIIANNGSQYFGLVKPGTSNDFTILLRNIGSEAFDISTISITGNNFSIKSAPENSTLDVQEALELVITYSPDEETSTPEAGQIVINTTAEENPFTINITADGGVAEWTYMVYLYEDGTGLNGFRDINEWEVNGSIPGVLNYLVLYDSEYDHEDGIYYVSKDAEGYNQKLVSKIVSTEFNEGLDMNDPEVLENFMIWCKNNYPAKKYGCNVWDHGSGIFKAREEKDWKYAIGEMTLWDLAKAVKAFVDVDGQGFDIFGFDLCLLGQVETVYELKDYTKVVIASEMNEPGNGWNYDTQFAPLNANPQLDLNAFSTIIVDEFTACYVASGDDPWQTTQVAIDTKKFKESFIPALNVFADQASFESPSINSALKSAYAGALYHDAGNCREHRDIGGFMKLLKAEQGLSTELNTAIDNVMAAYDDCIIRFAKNEYDSPEATGLKIWIANDINANTNADYYLNANQYLTFSETKWDEFLYYYAHPTTFAAPSASIGCFGSLVGRPGMVVNLFDNTDCAPAVNACSWTIEPATYTLLDEASLNASMLNVQFNEPGDYTISLTVNNGYGENVERKEAMISVRDFALPAPANLSYSISGQELTLMWDEPETGIIEEIKVGTDKLNESFENGWLPSGWEVKHSTTIDGVLGEPAVDEEKKNWFQCMNNSFGTKSGGYVNTGLFSAGIGYQAPGFNWLITSEIEVSEFDALNFNLWYSCDDQYSTNFRVMVYADEMWNETLFLTDGAEVNKYQEDVLIDLSDYVSKTVKIAFVYEYTDGYQLAIDDVRIVRSAPEGTPDGIIIKYVVFRDGQEVGESTDLSFTEQVEMNKSYSYTVKTVYEQVDGQSEASVALAVSTISTGIGNNESLLSVYPNPNNGTFNLRAEQFIGGEWALYNVAGQLVKQGLINESEIEISVNQSGIYLLRIHFAGNDKVIKVIVD